MKNKTSPTKRILQEMLKNELREEELGKMPSGWDQIGHVLIVNFKDTLSMETMQKIAEALLSLNPRARTVLKKGSIKGQYRLPEFKFLAGDKNTETIHKENKCIFKLNPLKMMFSAGNKGERERMAKLKCEGETVVDMFAGIGQFSIPMAVHGNPEHIYSIEINSVAYEYLCENIILNNVNDKITPILGDSRLVTPKGVADRVVMGLVGMTRNYISDALDSFKKRGILHYHEIVNVKKGFNLEVERVEKIADERDFQVTPLLKRIVKHFSPNIDHIVIDFLVEQKKDKSVPF